jgi:hypothetical protein
MVGHRSLVIFAATIVVVALAGAGGLASASPPAARTNASSSQHMSISCEYSTLCPDVVDPARVFGEDEYVGHDEPSLLFYSNKPGAGNRAQYSVTLPT